MHFTHIPNWGLGFPTGTLEVMLPLYSSFYLDMYLIIATIIAIIGFNWVLRKKKRRWTYLLFFIGFLIFEIPSFLTYVIMNLPSYIVNIVSFYLVGMMLWLVGWIILLALKNKSAQSLDSHNNSY
jgi:hypothetical protein